MQAGLPGDKRSANLNRHGYSVGPYVREVPPLLVAKSFRDKRDASEPMQHHDSDGALYELP